MKVLAHIAIWFSLLTITLIGGDVRYMYCSCSHKIVLESAEGGCCPSSGPCMEHYEISLPDGFGISDLQIDNVQQPLVAQMWDKTQPLRLFGETTVYTLIPNNIGPPGRCAETRIPLRV